MKNLVLKKILARLPKKSMPLGKVKEIQNKALQQP